MNLIWNITFALGVAAGLTFIVLYAIKARGRWYHYRMGWHLMATMASLTATFGGLLWESVVGNISERIWFIMIVSVVASMCHQTYLLVVTTRNAPDNGMRRRSTD